MAGKKFQILVCRGPECGERRGSRAVRDALAAALDRYGLADRVTLGWQSCFGRCTQGPNCLVQELAAAQTGGERGFLLATMPRGRVGRSALYNHLVPADVNDIIEQHILRDRPVSRLIEPAARSGPSYNAALAFGTDARPRGGGSEGES